LKGAILSYHWWQNTDRVDRLVDAAVMVDKKHQGQELIAIGQSPAWLLYTIGEYRRALGEEPKIRKVAFSGSFMQHSNFAQNEHDLWHSYHINSEDYPDEERRNIYIKYMKSSGVDYRSLQRKSAQGAGKKPVFFDYIMGGCSVASFMHMLRLSAADEPFENLSQLMTLHLIGVHSKLEAIAFEGADGESIKMPVTHYDDRKWQQTVGSAVLSTVGSRGESDVRIDIPRLVQF
jgi:hypothetical protein